MKIKQITLLAITSLFAVVAFAGDKSHHKMEIKVVSDDGDGETHVVLDSDDMDFDMHDMQVGENQSIVDKSGRPVLITRTEDGFALDVDGKTVEMPMIKAPHDRMAPRAKMKSEGVMIISGKEIDEATQQVIRSALEAAGHESVHFAGGHDGGPHEVRVVTKVVEVTK